MRARSMLAAAAGGLLLAGCTCHEELDSCRRSLAAAQRCGNGAVESGEDCDRQDVGSATCATHGFAGGTLACGSGCRFDTSGCWNARFVDRGDGTVSDNLTGLQWEKKVQVEDGGNPANPHDADNLYRWAGECSGHPVKLCQPTAGAAQLCAANLSPAPVGCEVCAAGEGTCTTTTTVWTWVAALNAANFGGHSDWRIPSRAELQSILDYADPDPPAVNAAFHGASCGPACADVTNPACSCTSKGEYWCALPYAPHRIEAWTVQFGVGYLNPGTIFGDRCVRAVRGRSSPLLQ